MTGWNYLKCIFKILKGSKFNKTMSHTKHSVWLHLSQVVTVPLGILKICSTFQSNPYKFLSKEKSRAYKNIMIHQGIMNIYNIFRQFIHQADNKLFYGLRRKSEDHQSH